MIGMSERAPGFKRILGIETSCDETAVSVIENGTHIRSQLVYSQIKSHQAFGGVVPEVASRMHTEKIHSLIDTCLRESALSLAQIDAIAVTYGPGLEGALLVGLAAAKAMAAGANKPLIPVNHLEGHMYAHFLSDTPPEFPFICLLVSGGHTLLAQVNDHHDILQLGSTRDDAVGEAFDKVARVLSLGYPGGPIVEKMAKTGNPKAFSFPRALRQSPFEFSFSGLKTAVLQQVNRLQEPLPIADLCASFQQAVIDTLISKSFYACNHLSIPRLILSGGVAANQSLVSQFKDQASKQDLQVYAVAPKLCTDNASMIAARAYHVPPVDPSIIQATPQLSL